MVVASGVPTGNPCAGSAVKTPAPTMPESVHRNQRRCPPAAATGWESRPGVGRRPRRRSSGTGDDEVRDLDPAEAAVLPAGSTSACPAGIRRGSAPGPGSPQRRRVRRRRPGGRAGPRCRGGSPGRSCRAREVRVGMFELLSAVGRLRMERRRPVSRTSTGVLDMVGREIFGSLGRVVDPGHKRAASGAAGKAEGGRSGVLADDDNAARRVWGAQPTVGWTTCRLLRPRVGPGPGADGGRPPHE